MVSYSNFLAASAKKMRKGKKVEEGSFFPGQIERIML